MKTVRERIKVTVDEVRRASYEEKVNSAEEKINILLDAILEFKAMLNQKTEKILELADKLEALTWFSIENEECMILLNDLIALSKDFHSTLIRNYITYNQLKTKGVAKTEIKEHKAAIDDFKESFTDLESVFFYLPEMPDFKETTRELSML